MKFRPLLLGGRSGRGLLETVLSIDRGALE